MVLLDRINDLLATKKIDGVAAIIKDFSDRILMVVENENKYWKKAGQLSIPMETVEKGEHIDEALKRGLKEELGFDLDKEKGLYKLDFDESYFPLLVKASKDLILIKLYIYNLCVENELSDRLSKFKNGEIRKVQQIFMDDIFSEKIKNLRPGTKEVLFGLLSKIPVIENGEYVGFLENNTMS